MAERKRLSEADTTPVNNSKKIKLIQTTLPFGTSTRPLCQYGSKCYRKHPDHLRAYRHPSTDEKEDDEDSSIPKPTEKTSTKNVASSSTSATHSSASSPVKHKTTSSNSTISLMELMELDGEKLLSQLYQMEFPADLYEFWKFCSNMNNKNPRGENKKFRGRKLKIDEILQKLNLLLKQSHPILRLDALKNLLNLELVGPFEILDDALKICKTLPNIHLHYRYYYDTPEFMTVIRTVDKKSQFHIGYYRDSPDELPSFVASNNANENNRFKICGDNLFAAIYLHTRHILKSNDKTDLKSFVTDLEAYAKKSKFSLEENTPKLNARKKKINCTLLNTLGMVVPFENDIGYRPVPLTKDQLKKVCDKFCNSSSEELCQTAEDDLQHVITCIQFANDECDYGEGLEFGLNLFLYGSSKLHSRILSLVPLAYQLLHRDLYGQILIDHLSSGRLNLVEDLNQIEKNK